MKILYVTTISGTMEFFPEHFKMLLEEGHTIELACNTEKGIPEFCSEMGLKVWNIPFSRSPLSKGNFSAIKKLRELVEAEKYDIIHTHTPNASACVRVACKRLRKKGLKVFYTAHGFHFYKGAPLLNWLVYYPVEWFCSFFTDTLITINREDYALAKKHMHAKKVEYVPGVGIDLEKFGNNTAISEDKRIEIGVPKDKVWLLAVGELITRKNHETLIRAIVGIPNVYLTIAGRGELNEYLSNIIKELHMEDRVKLLGFRTDIAELCSTADVFCMPSFQEGLPVALMEAMACGKPCAVSNIRGNVDLIEDENALFDPHKAESAKEAIEWILRNDFEQIGRHNADVVKNYSTDTVLERMKDIYFD